MSKLGLISNMTDEGFMIHVLNNLPKEYDVILDGLENYLTSSSEDALTIEALCEKLCHWHKKINNKNEERKEKKALGANNKQCKIRCCKCGKYGHKPNDHKCPEYKNKQKMIKRNK